MPTTEAKVILIGSATSGKSSLVQRLTIDRFNPRKKETFGIDFDQKKFELAADHEALLRFWDISASAICKPEISMHTRNANIVVGVVNKTDRESFDFLQTTLQTLRENKAIPSTAAVHLMINFDDQADCALTQEEINAYVRSNGFQQVFRVSAATGARVNDAFLTMAKQVAPRQEQSAVAHATPSPAAATKLSRMVVNEAPRDERRAAAAPHPAARQSSQWSLLGLFRCCFPGKPTDESEASERDPLITTKM